MKSIRRLERETGARDGLIFSRPLQRVSRTDAGTFLKSIALRLRGAATCARQTWKSGRRNAERGMNGREGVMETCGFGELEMGVLTVWDPTRTAKAGRLDAMLFLPPSLENLR